VRWTIKPGKKQRPEMEVQVAFASLPLFLLAYRKTVHLKTRAISLLNSKRGSPVRSSSFGHQTAMTIPAELCCGPTVHLQRHSTIWRRGAVSLLRCPAR
jgi:hypothetical protein